MKKIKNLLLLCLVVVSIVLLTGCSGTKRLEKAMEELNENSYTMEGNVVYEIGVRYDGQIEKQSISAAIKSQIDPNQSYTEIQMEGQTQYAYTKIVDDDVKVYSKNDSSWELVETTSLEEYTNETVEFVQIDVEDMFEKDGDVWVGDTAKLSEELEEAMKKLAEEMSGTGMVITQTSIDKYNIELDGKHVSKIDIEMTISMSYTFYGQTMSMTMNVSMPITISKIGETEVTVPSGLPTE